MRHFVSAIAVLFCFVPTLFGAAGINADGDEAPPSWSLSALRQPALPQVQNRAWLRTPIDHFILARLERENLTPAPPADKRTLLRRVYFDLIGLPPSPAAMQRFLADNSPKALDRVVDELLASPRHGERWARHWIDVVHFAETHGHDQDRIRTNAWPYRDYIINSLNEDKPYTRFIEEQIAADVLFTNEPALIPALGFLAAGPWDESSLRDIREDTVDRQTARYLDRDDVVMTTMSAFTSTTVHCARCHHHKFDPIPQQDYYALQAVFAATDRADRIYDSDPPVHARRLALQREKQRLEQKDKTLMASLLSDETQREVQNWLAESQPRWVTLTADTLVSAEGATLAKQADGSITSSGKRPERDSYRIEATFSPAGITAIRLELLTDDSLPHKGPGRQENGNLHLTEFSVIALESESSDGGNERSLTDTNGSRMEITRALADFSQDGWTVQHAIDGNPKTAWGIYPQVGVSHQAVFGLKKRMKDGRFRIVLDQQHGGGHLIGRFRLSVTTNAAPTSLLPAHLSDLAAKPQHEWSEEQRMELSRMWLTRKLDAELALLPRPRAVYAGASDFVPDGSHKPAKGPRPIHVLKRGDVTKPGEAAEPGALACVPDLPARFKIDDPQDEGARRAALAKWISSPRNPLTWRSIVNRVWHYHFGRGIVDTPNDFGAMGAKPTHPELLDWLAVHFRDDGGSLKRLHRLIVLSATYQQSSRHEPTAALEDGENRLLWRMNRSRLDAESIRDAVLQITGNLNLEMGGPSFMNFALSPGVHVTPVVDYSKVDLSNPALNRRSIYRFLFRTIPDPMMDTLDCPDGSQLAAARTSSYTALQAMTLLNDPFMVRQSEHFAEQLEKETAEIGRQIDRACELALCRKPSKEEKEEFISYVKHHGLANFCRVLLNSNEFNFVN